MTESAAERFNRDWEQIADDRKERGLDEQSEERQSRLYVDNETWTSAVTDAAPQDSEGNDLVQGAPFPQGDEPEPEDPEGP